MKLFSFTPRVLMVLSLVVPFLVGQGISPALACSGPGIPEPAERFRPGSESVLPAPGGIALLGHVLNESPVVDARRTVYLSDVQTVIPLHGEGIEAVVGVGPNGFGSPDCSGGPRLFAGEKVMLFLYRSRPLVGDGSPPLAEWQSGQPGTPILFDGNDAFYLSWGRFSTSGGPGGEQRIYVGESAKVLDLALTYFDVTPEQREKAFEFVLGTSAPKPTPVATSQRSAPSISNRHISPPDTGSGDLVVTE